MMKIVIINDYYKYGGAEIQALREKKILTQNGHETYLINFDDRVPEQFDYNRKYFNIHIDHVGIKKLIDLFFVRHSIYQKVNKILMNIKPDIIHVHNSILIQPTVLKCIKNYKVINTVHDYTIVCPKGTCVDNCYNDCQGDSTKRCIITCKQNNIKLYLRMIAKKFTDMKKKKIITEYICPSEALTKKALENGYNAVCINNIHEYEEQLVDNKIEVAKENSFLFYGVISSRKGIFQLIEAFDKFHRENNKDFVLYVIGNVDDRDKERFNIEIDKPYIKYLGFMPYDEIMRFYKNIKFVILPSLWLENYPNTILEAKAQLKVVLGSNRGGIPEMLMNDPNLLFDVNSIDSITETLRFVTEISDEDYRSIVRRNYKDLLERNSYESYYEKLIAVMNNNI